MPNAIKAETTPTLRLTMTTELNSLASAARTNASSAIANGTNLDKLGWIKLKFTPAAAPAAGAFVVVYLLMALDGSEYPEGSSSVDPGAENILMTIPITVANQAKIKQVGPFLIPPCDFKVIVENQTGQAWGASNGSLLFYTGNDEIQ